MKEIFNERRKEPDVLCVSYLLTCLLLVFTVLLLFQSAVSSGHLENPINDLCFAMQYNPPLSLFPEASRRRLLQAPGAALPFPPLQVLWSPNHFWNIFNVAPTFSVCNRPLFYCSMWTRCCQRANHASCSRLGSCPSVSRGRNIWTWRREHFHPWNQSTPASRSAERIKRCTHTGLTEFFKILNDFILSHLDIVQNFIRLSSDIFYLLLCLGKIDL